MGPLITDNISGEVACGSCGLVLIERGEDRGQENPTYDMEAFLSKSRTGAGTSLAIHDRGLFTSIDSQNKDASGNTLSGNMKYTIERLRKWDNRSKSTSVNRTFISVFIVFDSVRIKLSIPEPVIEEAAYIYRKAVSLKLTKGRNSKALACASLYVACREHDTPRTLRDIAKAGNIRRKELSRSYRILVEDLDLKLRPFDSSEFISRISNEVGISEKARRGALDLLSRLTELEISAGKNPMALAGSALYLSCVLNDEKKSQGDIAKAADVTAMTIRNRIQHLRKEFRIDTEDLKDRIQ
ncbi:MAG: transcription initiation factor IIB [Nitrosotalea sp.]